MSLSQDSNGLSFPDWRLVGDLKKLQSDFKGLVRRMDRSEASRSTQGASRGSENPCEAQEKRISSFEKARERNKSAFVEILKRMDELLQNHTADQEKVCEMQNRLLSLQTEVDKCKRWEGPTATETEEDGTFNQ